MTLGSSTKLVDSSLLRENQCFVINKKCFINPCLSCSVAHYFWRGIVIVLGKIDHDTDSIRLHLQLFNNLLKTNAPVYHDNWLLAAIFAIEMNCRNSYEGRQPSFWVSGGESRVTFFGNRGNPNGKQTTKRADQLAKVLTPIGEKSIQDNNHIIPFTQPPRRLRTSKGTAPP